MLHSLDRRHAHWTLTCLVVMAAVACSEAPTSAPRALPHASVPAAQGGHSGHRPSSSARVVPGSLSGAAHTVRQYFDVSNRLGASMQPARLAALFTASCPCQAQVASVRRAAARDEHFVGHATVNAVRASRAGDRAATVLADYDMSRSGLVTMAGLRVSSRPARRAIRWVFDLTLSAGRWRISRITEVS